MNLSRYAIFIILLIFVFSVKAINTDSLNFATKRTGNDTDRIDSYFVLADSYYKTYPDSALTIINIAYKMAKNIGYQKGEAEALRCMGIAYQNLGQDYTALKYYQDALAIYTQLNYAKGIGACYNNIGVFYFSTTNYNNAILNLTKALEYLMIAKDKEALYNTYNSLGGTYYNMEIFDKSADCYLKALQARSYSNYKKVYKDKTTNVTVVYDENISYNKVLATNLKSLKTNEKNNNKAGISSNLNNIGSIYDSLGHFDKALDYQKKALKINTELRDDGKVAKSLMNIGNIYVKQKKYDTALAVTMKALKLNEKSGSRKNIAADFSCIGKVYSLKGNNDSAMNYLSKSLLISEELNDQPGIVNNLLGLAEVSLRQNYIPKAESFGERAFTISQEIRSKTDMINSTALLYSVFKKANDYKRALYFYELNKLYKDSLVDDRKSQEIGRLIAKYEYDKREEKLVAEQLKNEIVNNNKLANQRYIIITFSLSTAILLLIIFIIYYRRNQKQKAYQDLQEKNKEIQKKNIAIEKQAEELTKLNALKTKLFSIIAHDLRSPYANSIDLINFLEQGIISQEEFVALLPNLTANMKSGSNLLDNLLAWSKSQMEGEKMNVEKCDLKEIVSAKVTFFEKNAKDKGIILSNNVTENCFILADKNMISLVVRNLLANAIKFCNNGDTVTISASMVNDKIQVCVTDTGVGIEKKDIPKLFGHEMHTTYGTAKEKGSGLGLILCKDFVMKNGGEIWVESEAGVGSKFCFTLPLA